MYYKKRWPFYRFIDIGNFLSVQDYNKYEGCNRIIGSKWWTVILMMTIRENTNGQIYERWIHTKLYLSLVYVYSNNIGKLGTHVYQNSILYEIYREIQR